MAELDMSLANSRFLSFLSNPLMSAFRANGGKTAGRQARGAEEGGGGGRRREEEVAAAAAAESALQLSG